MLSPTPYPAVNAVLQELLTGVQAILGAQVVGCYLHGSLALGDFDPQRSDVDFLVATLAALPDKTVAALGALHARLTAGAGWGAELEGSYIPLRALRRRDPADCVHPRIERGGHLRLEPHDHDWVIQRHVLREWGVALVGPAPSTLIDPVPPDDLRRAVLALLHDWWVPMIHDPARLHHDGYRAYAILTMGRILYTLHHGTVVSKPAAARWAQATLRDPWPGLIARALAWHPDARPSTVDEARAFIRFVAARL